MTQCLLVLGVLCYQCYPVKCSHLYQPVKTRKWIHISSISQTVNPQLNKITKRWELWYSGYSCTKPLMQSHNYPQL